MNLVITGTSSGIGQALAQHFLGAGHDVWGLARRPQPVQSRFYSSKCDVASWESIERVADEISQQWPHVDGLICCAGTQGVIRPGDDKCTQRLGRNGLAAIFQRHLFYDPRLL